jgi:hypothetical protein
MRRRPLIHQAYADHWSEEPRSIQFQEFLTNCRNSFAQDKRSFNPSERFNPLTGDQTLIDAFNHQYKIAYRQQWENVQRVFEGCLRKKDPKRHNIVECFGDEMISIEYFHNELFYTERWELFKISYEEADRDLQRTNIIPVSKKEKEAAIAEKQKRQIRWVHNWREHQTANLAGYAKMNKKEWLESEGISEPDFISAERLVRRLEIEKSD